MYILPFTKQNSHILVVRFSIKCIIRKNSNDLETPKSHYILTIICL